MNIIEIFGFNKPIDRPTPSLYPAEMKTVNLSYYDITKILKIAQHVAYCLAHLNRADLRFTTPSIGELNRLELADCMQDFINHKKQVPDHFSQDLPFSIRAQTLDNIRKLLFDFEVWLSNQSGKLDTTGTVFYHIVNDFEHCRVIRRKLRAVA